MIPLPLILQVLVENFNSIVCDVICIAYYLHKTARLLQQTWAAKLIKPKANWIFFLRKATELIWDSLADKPKEVL